MPAFTEDDIILPGFPGAADPPMWDPIEDVPDFDPNEAEMLPPDYGGLQALASLPSVIESQEQWDALPPWAKQLHHASAQGVQFTDADVNRFVLGALQEERRAQQKPEVVEIEEPGTGRKIPYIQTPAGNLQPLRQEPAARTERFTADDGRVMLLDKETGLARVVTDEAGNPIRAQERAQGMAAAMMEQMGNPQAIQAQATLAKKMVEFQAIQQRMQKDGPDARAGLFRGTLQDQAERLLAEIAQLEVLAGGSAPAAPAGQPMPQGSPEPMPQAMPQAMPSVTPQQTPQPTPHPMPTPQPAQPAQPQGQPIIAVNPQTGETIIWNGQAWVPQP
jgi:hypothetical protein